MPSFRRDPTPADALSDYRNALVREAPPEELARLAAPIDPALIETLHWARQTEQRARASPDPLFAKRLERDLRQAFVATPPSLHASGAAPAGTTAARGRSGVRLPARDSPVARPGWSWKPFAAAAALVCLLVGSLVALRFASLERPETQLGAVGEPTTETFVDATVAGAPVTWTPLTVEHWRFMPGDATLAIPPLDGPQWVVADGGGVIATVDGAGQDLAPGQSLVVPAGQELVLRNPGLGETSIFRGVAAAGFSFEDYDRAVITKEIALDTEAHEALPPGSSHVVFDRLTIPPGTLMTAEAATGQDWFDIMTGTLGLTLVGDAVPEGFTSGKEREFAAADSIPRFIPGTRITLRNIGEDPLVLLRLRVSTTSGDAPAAGSQ